MKTVRWTEVSAFRNEANQLTVQLLGVPESLLSQLEAVGGPIFYSFHRLTVVVEKKRVDRDGRN